MEARYTLQRAATGFSGPAAFSVGSTAPRTATETILVPLAAVEQFLQTLSGALLREGYEPRAPPSGGASPDVRIEMTHQTGALTLFTRSPGADFLPWATEFEGRTYTIESTAPAKAFEALRPYLKREVLDALAREAIGGR